MTFITDITKQDLLDMIEERLKMFALPSVHKDATTGVLTVLMI